MSPFSPLALGGGAALSSPALYAALVDGTLPVETALTRYLVAVAVFWLGVTLLGALIQQTADPGQQTVHDARALPGLEGGRPTSSGDEPH